MSANTGIEWTDHTFNIAWGCLKISPGCKNCYADRQASRYGHRCFGGYERRTFGEKHWKEPLKWDAAAAKAGEKALVFTSSMCDVFEDHPTIAREREKLWPLIKSTPNLIWQVLTKRAMRIKECLPADWGEGYPNVALGVSVENQEYAIARVPYLSVAPARWRFISVEPMLGSVDILPFFYEKFILGDLPDWWVICGGESGPDARPIHPEWVRTLRDQCNALGVPFFFKQWGEWLPACQRNSLGHYSISVDRLENGISAKRIGKVTAGRSLDGRIWDQMPIEWCKDLNPVDDAIPEPPKQESLL